MAAPTSVWRNKWSIVAVAALVSAFALPVDVTDPEICTVEWAGSDATLSWLDDGGRHVLRRDGSWLVTLGAGVESYVDQGAPANATYLLRTWKSGNSTDRTCSEPPPPTTTTSTSSTSTTSTSSTSTSTSTSSTSTSTSTSTVPPSSTTTTTPPPEPGCSAERSQSIVTLNWLDEGGRHVVRRNGSWLATPGSGVSSFVDASAPFGASYEIRTWSNGQHTDRPCVEEPPPPPPPPIAERVIHVSIDALRVDYIAADTMPNLTGLIAEGVSTLNARTDPAYTRTLPNHTSQFTGRSVYGTSGHQVDFNEDAGTTIHSEAGHYISSVFDVVHDNGGRTVAYAGKSKFAMVDRNWNAANGAPDTTGPDDGTDKIDTYLFTDPSSAADLLLDDLANAPDLEYAFFHIRYPDRAGHDFGWGSPEYLAAVEDSDAVLGRLIDAVESDPVLASTTSIIVLADHGGPIGQFLHGEETSAENYTIPFVVWGPGVTAGADLYDLNDSRVDPGGAQPGIEGVQPIRGHEVANLALSLLGYHAVPGSVFNASQDLRLS